MGRANAYGKINSVTTTKTVVGRGELSTISADLNTDNAGGEDICLRATACVIGKKGKKKDQDSRHTRFVVEVPRANENHTTVVIYIPKTEIPNLKFVYY